MRKFSILIRIILEEHFKILGENKTAQVGGKYSNIGNWGAHNYHIIRFTNDTSRAATIYGYIGSILWATRR